MQALRGWLGVELDEVSWREKLVSVAGGALALLAVLLISEHVLGAEGARIVVASMGASAVLLFAVPHGALSQPWPLVGGHLIAALIGVTSAELIHQRELAAAVAVGLTIGAMHQFKCIHPPGGATALTAVIGGDAIRSLGYEFVLRPVLVNVVVILAVAVLFNGRFPWRRYPSHRSRTAPPPPRGLDHASVVAALRSLDSFIDITEDDLTKLVTILSDGRTGDRPVR